MSTSTAAVVERVSASAYRIPTDAPEGDGTFAWDSTTLVLAQLHADGVVGTGWTYGSAGCAEVIDEVLAPVVRGRDPMDVPGSWQRMVDALRNVGRPGVGGMALSAVDCAMWDLKARLLDLPLCRLLGRVHDGVPVYGSGGFTTYDEQQLSDQLKGWVVDQGFSRVKIKIGESRGTHEGRDLSRIQQAREVIGPDVQLFVDANGAYTVGQAVRMADRMRPADVWWFEEPVSSDDLDGLATVRANTSADVTAGEYGFDLAYFGRMCAARAVDCLQVDVSRCGGITELLRVAAVAAVSGLQVSGHCAPNLHVDVLAAVPNLRHLEWFHDHVRIESMLFEGVRDPTGGVVAPNLDSPGHGLTWRSTEAERWVAA
jgi:L-alanine-DL-glutamate epimerase-like enolase superfamily enzyme